jgi:hypothetical protein
MEVLKSAHVLAFFSASETNVTGEWVDRRQVDVGEWVRGGESLRGRKLCNKYDGKYKEKLEDQVLRVFYVTMYSVHICVLFINPLAY